MVASHYSKGRTVNIYITPNNTFVSVDLGIANKIRHQLKLLKKPYNKREVDCLIENLNACSIVDSNKCAVYFMCSQTDNLVDGSPNYYITPDTLYLIDSFRPILLKYLVSNNGGDIDTLDYP